MQWPRVLFWLDAWSRARLVRLYFRDCHSNSPRLSSTGSALLFLCLIVFSDDLVVQSENDVFLAVVNWFLQHEGEHDQKDSNILWQLIRWPMMSKALLSDVISTYALDTDKPTLPAIQALAKDAMSWFRKRKIEYKIEAAFGQQQFR